MIDSTNPRILADQIRALWNKVKSITGLPATTSATDGQILKLNSEKEATWADEYSYTPPAYSETEVNTGQKWIDGKEIYMKVISGTVPAIEASSNITVDELTSDINLIDGVTIFISGDVVSLNRFYLTFTKGTHILRANGVTVAFASSPYSVIYYYTKPDPVPAQVDKAGEDPEPETKKTTRKKSS